MRTSFLSRSVIAVASLAIGSVALAAAPANAASSSGVTRDTILTAVNGIRTAQANPSNGPSPAITRALRDIVLRGCDVRADQDEYAELRNVQLTTAGDDADGLLLTAYVENDFTDEGQTCTIAAFAATDGAFQLNGSATIAEERYDEELDAITTVPLQTSTLSGDAFVTAPLTTNSYDSLTASASGNATKMTSVPTSRKVADKKTKAEKKAAKRTYDKRLKAAKKSYTKALDKAGNSTSKKSAAKKAYSKKRAFAKAQYKTATSNVKIVKAIKKVLGESRPFSIVTLPTMAG